jgi:hypothetical protein
MIDASSALCCTLLNKLPPPTKEMRLYIYGSHSTCHCSSLFRTFPFLTVTGCEGGAYRKQNEKRLGGGHWPTDMPAVP